MRKIIAIKFIIIFILIFTSTAVVLIVGGKGSDVSDKSPPPSYRIKGDPNAKVIIVEYSDFACPSCAYMNDYLNNLIKYFANDFVLYFKHLPLTDIHPNSLKAAIWAECVGIEENKFFDFADLLFKNRNEWANANDYVSLFEKYTKEVGANLDRVRSCYNSGKGVEFVEADIKKAEKMNLNSTPTFFVNGRIAIGGRAFIEEIKKEKR